MGGRMISFIIKFTDPNGVISYMPVGFGFDAHEHTSNEAQAERFDNEAVAWRALYNYVNPPAFWNSERQHRKNMQEQFRGWKYEVVSIN
jgi:hypothetical protein